MTNLIIDAWWHSPAVQHTPDESVAIMADEVLIDGKNVPVLHQWPKHPALAAHVRSSPRFRRTATPASGRIPGGSPLPDPPLWTDLGLIRN